MSNEAEYPLFEHYRQNLNLVWTHPRVRIEPDRDDIISCPLCFNKVFTVEDIKAKRLSLEHVPPKALNGQGIVLTCKNCNNKQGSHLDSFLVRYINDFDALSGKGENYADGDVWTEQVGKVRVEFRSNQLGWEVNPVLHPRASSPENVNALNNQFHQGSIDTIHFTLRITNPRRAYLALLRAGYLYAFAYMGYGFLLNANLMPVRYQLANPKEDVFPINAVHLLDELNVPDEMLGLNITIQPKHMKSYYVVFDVKAKNSLPHRYGVMLPGPNSSDGKVFLDLKDNGLQGIDMTYGNYGISFENKLEFPFIAHDIWNAT